MDYSLSLMKARDDNRHLSSLSNLEECMWNIEDTGLEKKDKWYPLVIRLVFHFIPILIILSNSWMDHMLADLSRKIFREREGAHDEAVGVHNRVWYGPVFRMAIVISFPSNSTEVTRTKLTKNTRAGRR